MKNPKYPLASVHIRPKSGCGFMLISTKTGDVRDCAYGKSCRKPIIFGIGAPAWCDRCKCRIYLQPLRKRQRLGIRCFDCCKVFCFRCIRRHFRLKCKLIPGGKWKARRKTKA